MNLIGHTTTQSGLAIRSELDENSYPTGQPVTAEQMESLSLKRDKFHGDWNYSLSPENSQRTPAPVETQKPPCAKTLLTTNVFGTTEALA